MCKYKNLFSRILIKMRAILAITFPNFNGRVWSGSRGDPTRDWSSNIEDIGTRYMWEYVAKGKFKSVLEIGSNYGNRLFSEAKRNPHIEFVGIDINSYAVRVGNKKSETEKISNLRFQFSDVSKKIFNPQIDERYDLVFSWATLIYIHPSKIKRSLEFMYLSAIKKIIIIEQMDLKLRKWPFYLGVQIGGGPNWVRNYEKIFLSIISPNEQVKFSYIEVPNNIWSPGGGSAKTLIIDLINRK
jgi:hypothetical protein